MPIHSLGIKSIVERAWCRVLYALWPAFRLVKPTSAPPNAAFAIGITTFKDRFDVHFAPLLSHIAYQFPDTQVIVYANGHVDEPGQRIYLPKIEAECRKYGNVELHSSVEPRGLSSIWNHIIRVARHKKVFLLNDDLCITPLFRHKLMRTGILDTQVSLINNIWSHFLISKEVIERVGWFDESFLEIGGEDDDYTWRLAIAGEPLENFHCLHVWNESKPLRRNSYGHDMTGEHRYSRFNSERLAAKWTLSKDSFPGSTRVPRTGVFVAPR